MTNTPAVRAKAMRTNYWWACLEESERQQIVVGVPGCLFMGRTRSYNSLSPEGKDVVNAAYSSHEGGEQCAR